MKKQRYWLKSSRFRRVYIRDQAFRNLLRLERLLANKPPFKRDFCFDDCVRVEVEMVEILARPSPFIELLNKGTYGENLGSTFITKT